VTHPLEGDHVQTATTAILQIIDIVKGEFRFDTNPNSHDVYTTSCSYPWFTDPVDTIHVGGALGDVTNKITVVLVHLN
jgi:hypothetical protein